MNNFSSSIFPNHVDLKQSFKELDNTPGAVGYGLTFGQDGNFPFPYDPATDTYYGYRWDFLEEVDVGKIGIREPLTKENVQNLTGLYLTSNPYFYNSHHLTNPGRLTKVTFRKPNTLMVPDLTGIVEQRWSGNPEKPADFNLTSIGKRYFDMGYAGFFFNDPRMAPELLILNPKEFVTGAIWVDFEEGELQSRYRAFNGATALESVIKALSPVDLDRAMGM